MPTNNFNGMRCEHKTNDNSKCLADSAHCQYLKMGAGDKQSWKGWLGLKYERDNEDAMGDETKGRLQHTWTDFEPVVAVEDENYV